ncbi:ATP-binding protein [Bacillus pumilus]|uniref:ATP-binding protein n=1 Tax=Bacillus pumilus TaxID=1408 RepID=UPI0030004812
MPSKFCELFGKNADGQQPFTGEVWKLTASTQGRKVERQMRRIGRSYNNAEFFISQSKQTLVSLLPFLNQVNEKTS